MKVSLQMLSGRQDFLFTDEHSAQLPVVRITKIILENFKNVEYGEIDFYCGKYPVSYGQNADILGLYGQNGSGKTALIEALYILKQLLRGSKVQNLFSECINKNAKFAKLTFLFELQYEDGRIRKAMYEFCLDQIKITDDAEERMDAVQDFAAVPYSKYRVRVFDEVLSMSGPFHGSDQRMNPVIDTTGDERPFGPKSRHKFMIGPDKNNRKALDLEVNRPGTEFLRIELFICGQYPLLRPDPTEPGAVAAHAGRFLPHPDRPPHCYAPECVCNRFPLYYQGEHGY